MISGIRLALAAIAFHCCLSACKKEEKPKQNVAFAGQPLNVVLEAIKGRWRAVYSTGVTIAGSSQTRVADTALGYYTWFYSDHIIYANRAGDSLSFPVVWTKVAYDEDSLYAFVSPDDRRVIVGDGFAVLRIVNDTLSIGSVDHGIDYGLGVIYKKD